MDKQLELAFQYALGLAQQLITLSAGILTLSIAFMKDILKTPSKSDQRLLAIAWAGYLLTILAGIIVSMTLTGWLVSRRQPLVLGGNVRTAAAIQIFLFLAATTIFIIVAVRGIGRQRELQPPDKPLQPTAPDQNERRG